MYGSHLKCKAQLFAVTVCAPEELLLSEEHEPRKKDRLCGKTQDHFVTHWIIEDIEFDPCSVEKCRVQYCDSAEVVVEVRLPGTLVEALPSIYTPTPFTALTPYFQHAQ